MNAQEKLLRALASYQNFFITLPVITNVGFSPVDFSRGALQDPAILELITDAFTEKINFSKFDLLAALPISGVSITTALSLRLKKPFVIVRDDVKRPGRPKIMGEQNFLRTGARVVMIDDWLASGKNKEEGVRLLEEAGAKVEMIACFGDFDMPDNERGPMHELQKQGIKMETLVSWSVVAKDQHAAGVLDDEMYEWIILRLTASAFADDSAGLLTKSVEFLRRNNAAIDPAIKDFLQSKGVVC